MCYFNNGKGIKGRKYMQTKGYSAFLNMLGQSYFLLCVFREKTRSVQHSSSSSQQVSYADA